MKYGLIDCEGEGEIYKTGLSDVIGVSQTKFVKETSRRKGGGGGGSEGGGEKKERKSRKESKGKIEVQQAKVVKRERQGFIFD